jgi:FkbM family methyltransferase
LEFIPVPPHTTESPDNTERNALEGWLIARTVKKSSKFPGQSAHFDTFPPRLVTVPAGHTADYLGNLWPKHFGLGEQSGQYIKDIPAVSEEYFEFLDIFEAAIDAERAFTIMEWGAGFARWTSLGIAAARLRGIEQINVACVEAHPQHIKYIEENFDLLKMSAENAVIFPFALSGKSGTDIFVIGMPQEFHQEDTWYGQALTPFNDLVPSGKFYDGSPLLENDRGWQGIQVQVEPASSVLRNYEFIDLIDMDLQGAEADVVDESIVQLNNQVRRLHIGTHGPEIEERLRATLSANDWIKLRDLPVAAETETCFGPVTCVDGLQSWFNPRFPPPGWKM